MFGSVGLEVRLSRFSRLLRITCQEGWYAQKFVDIRGFSWNRKLNRSQS
jgi:hypothetical protein